MAIVIDINELGIKGINRQRCLRQNDVKPVEEIVSEITKANNEQAIIALARQIISQNDRNRKAANNERNINFIKDYVLDNTTHGDVITFDSVLNAVDHEEINISDYGAKYYAVLAALDDLVNSGDLLRKTVTKPPRYGYRRSRSYSHINIYIVQ